MKKTLFKISLVAAFVLCTHFGYGHTQTPLLGKSLRISWAQMERSSKNNQEYAHYLALNTDENLKAYHLGLKALFPSHHISTVEEIVQTIHSHSAFCGTLSKADGINLWKKGEASFLIFEEKDCEAGHFYVAYGKGLRHFTVRSITLGEAEVGSLDNGTFGRYPYLDHFLACTFS